MEKNLDKLFNEIYNSIISEDLCDDFDEKFSDFYEIIYNMAHLYFFSSKNKIEGLKKMKSYMKKPNLYMYSLLNIVKVEASEYEEISKILVEYNCDPNIIFIIDYTTKYFGVGQEMYNLIELYNNNKDILLDNVDMHELLKFYLGPDKINNDNKESPKYKYNSMCEKIVEICDEEKRVKVKK